MKESDKIHAHCRFNPEEGAPGTHWIGGWVGARAGLDAVEERKNLLPPSGIKPLFLRCLPRSIVDIQK
jgi:hypothetical protein